MQVNRMDPQDIAGRVGGAWGWVLGFGIVTLLAGIVSMAWPDQTILVVAVLFAVQILVDGVFNLVRAIGGSGESGGFRVLLMILGIFSIIVGVLALQNIVQTVAVLVLILGAYWVVHGIIEAVVAIADRNMPHRGLQITAGAIGAIAGDCRAFISDHFDLFARDNSGDLAVDVRDHADCSSVAPAKFEELTA